MVGDVDPEMIDESALGFGRAPGSTKESIEVRSKHGAGVIERE